MTLTGCGGSSKDNNKGKETVTNKSADGTKDNSVKETDNNSDSNGVTIDPDNSATNSSGTFKGITDMADYWNNLYTGNEAAINKMEAPLLELVTPSMCFVVGVQYDLLNLNQADGRFEGALMLAGYPGFVEKKGSQLTFGYEDTLKEDGFSSQMLKGDKLVESGSCDLDKGHYFADSFTDRAGTKITRSTSEFQKEADGSMSTITVQGSTLNWNNEESLTTTYIFIRSGKNQYDFVIATSTKGTAYDAIPLEADMSKEKAISLFKAAGATVTKSGGIKDGAIYLD
jgi:hypothetical protein